MRQILYPWLNENVVGGGVEFGALLAFGAFILVVGFQTWAMWTPIKNFFGIGEPARPQPRLIVNEPVQNGPGVDQGLGALIVTEESQHEQTNTVPTLENSDAVVAPTDEVVELFVTEVSPTDDVFQQLVPTNTAKPDRGIQRALVGRLALARFSNYWPDAGGINCDADCDLLASGGNWRELYDWGTNLVACPAEFEFWTRFEWPVGSGLVWICLDRGEAITTLDDGTFWLDFLMEYASVDYGSLIWVKVLDD